MEWSDERDGADDDGRDENAGAEKRAECQTRLRPRTVQSGQSAEDVRSAIAEGHESDAHDVL